MTVEQAYQELGIRSGSDSTTVKAAWRDQVRRWHPDRHPDNPQASEYIRVINAAYQLLQRVDQTQISPSPDPYQWPHPQVYPSRGEDLQTEVELSLIDAIGGVDVVVDIERWELCQSCGGIDPSQVHRCNACHGFGREIGSVSLRAKVPSGVRDGDKIRLGEVGNAGLWGGIRGDVVVCTRLIEDELWEQEGDRLLLTDIPLSLQEALLGGTFQIPTPHGWKKLKLSGPVNLSRLYRVSEAGYISEDGKIGDLYCSFLLSLPQLNSDQRAAFQQFWAFVDVQEPRGELLNLGQQILGEEE
jgi:DnaJ-class molecular chaperone